MVESHVAKQLRLAQEAHCSRIFDLIYPGFRCGVTLLIYDYDAGPLSHVSWKSDQPIGVIIKTLEMTIARWKTKLPAMATQQQADRLGMPTRVQMEEVGDRVKAQLGEGEGYGVFWGRLALTQYIGSGERDGMIRLLESEVLPGLRGTTH